MNDEELTQQLLDGAPSAFATVQSWIERASARFFSTLGEDSEDLRQEIFIDLISALREGRFLGTSSLRTYVHSCVSHKCIDRLRAKRRRTWLTIDEIELVSKSPSPLASLESSERIAVALSVQNEMPEPCREIWRLLDQGLSYKEISQNLGVAEGALRVRALRCRKRALAERARVLSQQLARPARS